MRRVGSVLARLKGNLFLSTTRLLQKFGSNKEFRLYEEYICWKWVGSVAELARFLKLSWLAHVTACPGTEECWCMRSSTCFCMNPPSLFVLCFFFFFFSGLPHRANPSFQLALTFSYNIWHCQVVNEPARSQPASYNQPLRFLNKYLFLDCVSYIFKILKKFSIEWYKSCSM